MADQLLGQPGDVSGLAGVPGLAEVVAGGKSSRGEASSAVAADSGALASVGQGQQQPQGRENLSQLMTEIIASLPLMAPWRLKASTSSAPKSMDTSR